MIIFLWHVALIGMVLFSIRYEGRNHEPTKALEKAADEAMRFQREMIKWGE